MNDVAVSKSRYLYFARYFSIWSEEVRLCQLANERSLGHFYHNTIASTFLAWKYWLDRRRISNSAVARIVDTLSRHMLRHALLDIKCYSFTNARRRRDGLKCFHAWKQFTECRIATEEKVDRSLWLIQRRKLRYALSRWLQRVEKRKRYDGPEDEVCKLIMKNKWKRWRKAYRIAKFQNYWGRGNRGALVQIFRAWRAWVEREHMIQYSVIECNIKLARFCVCVAFSSENVFSSCTLNLPYSNLQEIYEFMEGRRHENSNSG
jgi:hypothetical protein